MLPGNNKDGALIKKVSGAEEEKTHLRRTEKKNYEDPGCKFA